MIKGAITTKVVNTISNSLVYRLNLVHPVYKEQGILCFTVGKSAAADAPAQGLPGQPHG